MNIKISQYKIGQCLKKKTSELYDIVICNPDFLTKSTTNIKYSLKTENPINSDTNILDNYIFSVYKNGSGRKIYTNKFKSNNNLFSQLNLTVELPFIIAMYNDYHFVIHDVDKHIINKIKNCNLNFTWTVANLDIHQKYI